MTVKESEIESKEFFLSPKGRLSPKEEPHSDMQALYNETSFEDNATGCRFPARKKWLQEQLDLEKSS